MAITVAMQSTVAAMYAALFGRAPEKAGLDYWCGEMDKGITASAIAQTMYNTEPARAYYPDGISNADLVKTFYKNVLGRDGDADGLAFWEARLVTLGNKGALIAEMVANVQSYAGTDPAGLTSKALFDNKVAVGLTYAVTLGKEDVALATEVLKLVTATDKTAAEALANAPSTFTLTTGVDTIEGTAVGATINAVASALSAENTLNGTDVIDGGAGFDTLKVDLKSNFTGFTATKGSMKGVESIELTNASTIARSFDATGVTDAVKYSLTAADSSISLSNLAAAGIEVNVNGQKSGTTTIGFTTKAVEGTADALTLGVNAVGTAAVKDAAGTTTTAAKYVTVAAAGIENLTINATGDNFVNLAGAASKAITAKGTGTLAIEAVGTVTSFDASAVKGAVTADLTGAASGTLATVKGGEGNDTITVDLGDLTANANISGGAGTNTLKVSGAGTLQPTLSQFQTVELNGITGDTTISGKNASDLSKIAVKGTTALANTVTVASLNNSALTVSVEGTQGGTVQLTSPTVLTYETTSTAANTAAKGQSTVSTVVTAGEATNATINIGAYTKQTGNITVNKATSVALNVASGKTADTIPAEQTEFNAVLTANAAQSVVVKAEGVLGTSTQIVAGAATLADITANGGGTLDLDVAKAQQVNITAGAALNLSTSTFSAAEQVTIAANVGHVDGTGENFAKISSLNLSGAGTTATKLSQVTVGNLGSADTTNAITVTATGLKGGATIGTIDTKAANVTVTATEVTGNVVLGNIGATSNVGNVTINAATMGSTKVGTISTVKSAAVQINATGLLGKDASGYSLQVGNVAVADDGAVKSGSISVNASGSNDLDIGTLSAKTVSVDLSGYLGGNVDGTGTGTVAKLGAVTGQAVTIKGTELGTNALTANLAFATGQTSSLAATGGLQADTLNVGSAVLSTQAATISFAGGDGDDTIMFADNVNLTHLNSKLTLSSVKTLDVAAGKAVVVKAADLSGSTIAVGTTGGSLTLNGTDAADTIDTSLFASGAVTIAGGKGNDTIKLGAATETVEFSAVANNGADTISGFTAGANKDVLKVSTLATLLGSTSGGVDADFTAVSTAKVAAAAFEVIGIAAADNAAADWSNVTAKISGALTIVADTTAGNANSVILISNGTDTRVYLFSDDATSNATVEATELTLVGTVSGVLVGAFDATNFV